MHLYNLDTKVTDKSYEILNSHIEDQRQLDTLRINEIRSKCRDILERNGIFEDRKNGIIYQVMEKELGNLERNIDYFNEYYLEELTKNKIDLSIDNITAKIDSLENNAEFYYEDDNSKYNKSSSESNIRNMLFTFFESYKNNTINLLSKAGYSQNTIDEIEEDILEYVTSKSSDVLTEKISQDRIKAVDALNQSLNELSVKVISEAEARYNCEVNGQVFDELKEKRDIIKAKAHRLEEIRMQIASLDIKSSEISQITNNERVYL
ncbi:MAG: hypothetical protein ACI4ON_05325 [Clostridia bacterium]